jgi:hypothetical protein
MRHRIIHPLTILTITAVLMPLPLIKGDTLFKGKDPVKIGHGTQAFKKITWTTCSGQKTERYDTPPYDLDKSDNCSVGPPTFGLECEGERCKVVDAKKLQKYLPEANEGSTVSLHIDEEKVELGLGPRTLRIER